MNCSICQGGVFLGVGKGCKMCGMALDDEEDFCCKICMRKHNAISRKISELKKNINTLLTIVN